MVVIMIVAVIIVKRHIVPLGIAAVKLITSGMGAPSRMHLFPIVKPFQVGCVERQPNLGRPQIIILGPHNADILLAVPGIGFGNCRLHGYYRRRNRDLDGNHRS